MVLRERIRSTDKGCSRAGSTTINVAAAPHTGAPAWVVANSPAVYDELVYAAWSSTGIDVRGLTPPAG